MRKRRRGRVCLRRGSSRLGLSELWALESAEILSGLRRRASRIVKNRRPVSWILGGRRCPFRRRSRRGGAAAVRLLLGLGSRSFRGGVFLGRRNGCRRWRVVRRQAVCDRIRAKGAARMWRGRSDWRPVWNQDPGRRLRFGCADRRGIRFLNRGRCRQERIVQSRCRDSSWNDSTIGRGACHIRLSGGMIELGSSSFRFDVRLIGIRNDRVR